MYDDHLQLSCLVSVGLGATVYFFFTGKRRHTIFDGDWISDVCSPILSGAHPAARGPLAAPRLTRAAVTAMRQDCSERVCHIRHDSVAGAAPCRPPARRWVRAAKKKPMIIGPSFRGTRAGTAPARGTPGARAP